MSLTVVTIDKDGVIAEHTIKKYVESDLYKACGHKTASRYFTHIHTWNFASGASASLYGKCYDKADGGKSYGKEDMINKYNFPPPADNVLLYGTCCIVMKQNAIPANMTVAAWRTMYNTLFKGFEDLKDTESADEADSDDDEEDKADITRDGYEKDGFVVSESESDSDTDSDTEAEDENEPAGDGEDTASAGSSDNESVDGDLELEPGDEADNEAEPEDEMEDEDAETEENYASDDEEDGNTKSKKRKLSSSSKKQSKSKGKSKVGGSGDILLFETNELEKEEYIATDDEA